MAEYYTLEFDNPYPDGNWRQISNFRYLTDLVLLRFDDPAELTPVPRKEQFIVAAPYRVSFEIDGAECQIEVPAGMLTDLVSVPDELRSIVGRVGPHLESCIIHDFLYIAWQDLDGMPTRENGNLKKNRKSNEMREFADDLMLAGFENLSLGFNKLLIHAAVRSAGGTTFRRMDKYRYVDLSNTRYAALAPDTS